MKKALMIYGVYFLFAILCFFLTVFITDTLSLMGATSPYIEEVFVIVADVTAAILTIKYGYRKGYIERQDFHSKITKSQSLYALVLLTLIFISVVAFNKYVPLFDLIAYFKIDYSSFPYIILYVLTIPLYEEIIYRGMMTKSLLGKYNPTKAIIISAIIYAITHYNPAQIPELFVLGILLGWIYYKTGSILLGIVLHYIYNLLCVTMTPHLGTYLSKNNGTAAIILVAASLAILPFAIKGAKVAFAKSE